MEKLEAISKFPSEFLMGALVIISVFLTAMIVLIVWIIKTRDVKIKDIEIVTNSQKELYRTEGKNTLDNQTSNSHNILKKI